MNIIIVGKRHGQSKTYSLGPVARFLLLTSICVLPFAMGATGYLLAAHLADKGLLDPIAAKAWEEDLDDQRQELQQIRQHADLELDGLTLRLAELQAKLLRIDALGERLIDITKINADEFDFSSVPAVGGPGTLGETYQAPEIQSVLDNLASRIDRREQQLEVLDDLLLANKIKTDTFVAGRPIKRGWMSSRYGKRTDPFNGRLAWHAGVDFAGKEGSDVIAVASGIVTWASDRYGYGKLVEINHGNGYKTRYAHGAELKVKLGDVVRKGDVVAAMGSSGRSTGPHVHFEVYKNGRTVDPAAYLHRTLR
ncbi:MAG: M23 family metallopeptidase [Oleispira antarctica]|uniref:Peptidase family M23B. By similarity n=1 Tax=Oleispira antarctica RB-8 TaxID=698738 RepID=R4YPT5_OLEAN|nr:M23 family metallopeptidase [Oleispira antarctica]MBQ0794082.1 M23 family metallopeptidase [Oleispira antarctica]CCK77176.1 Peptidase family M23B. By similarity [Oleispira antarctica RB-8]|tara:strand:- start:101 stop:1027 length:927 start_codon:yes stop_codon:yes gene_type:complete